MSESFVLTNGLLTPEFTMDAKVHTRFRIIFAATADNVELSLNYPDEDLGCSFELLAKDGVYLSTSPRNISKAFLAPGSRADIAVMCSLAGTVELSSSSDDDAHVVEQTLLTIIVEDNASSEAEPTYLATFNPVLPDYLADLTTDFAYAAAQEEKPLAPLRNGQPLAYDPDKKRIDLPVSGKTI